MYLKKAGPVEHIPGVPHGHPFISNPYITLMAGNDGVGFIHCCDGILVVPLDDDDNVLMAVERSTAFDCDVLVQVGGSAEPGEPLEQTTNRELQEELGWCAKQIVFLARDLTPSKLDGDEVYPITTRKIPLDSFVSLCCSRELLDAPSIAGLCLAQRFVQNDNDNASFR